jgi:hypothetical protein
MKRMDKVQTKAAVSVSEMARMVGLSRARFYQLIGSAFPKPLYDAKTKRPFYNEELQQVCLEVRRRNCGIDGKPVLFYARRTGSVVPTARRKRKPPQPKHGRYAEIVEGVRALGLTTATAAQVEAAVCARYKEGTEGVDLAEVIRAVFLDLKRQNTGGNEGR